MPSVIDRLLSALSPEFRQIRADITALQEQVKQMTVTQEQFNVRMTQIDDATNEIAKDLQDLRDKLAAAGGVSDESLAVLDSKIARLQVLGADPEQPVPPVEG